jgi:hypothetical protein
VPTPEEWATRLHNQLEAQRKHARQYDDIYTGARRLAVVESEYRDVFGIQPTAADLLALTPPDTNVAAVGVDALSERLQVEDFALAGEGSAEEQRRVTAAAADLWTGSDMDVMQSVATVEALIKGRSYLQLGQGADGATISVEDPEQMAVVRDHAPPYDVVAGLKVAPDPWGEPERVTLWLPGRTYGGTRTGGAFRLDGGVTGPDRPPLYELAYRQRLIAEPRSYIAPVASMADSYALLMAYLVIAARFGAVPIVTMSGVSLPRHPDTGRVLPFGTDPTRPDLPPRPIGATEALATENPDGRFGRIDAGQLAGYIAALEMLLSSITAIHRTPPSYYGQGARSGTSGETVKAGEAGLERRKIDAQRYLGATWRRVVSDAVSLDVGRPVRVLPRWANTETHIEAQDADAVQKYVAAGIDLRTVLEHIGFPRQTVEQAIARQKEAQQDAALLLQGIDARIGAGGAGSTALDATDPDATDPDGGPVLLPLAG